MDMSGGVSYRARERAIRIRQCPIPNPIVSTTACLKRAIGTGNQVSKYVGPMHIEECKALAQRFCRGIRQVDLRVKTAPRRVSRVYRRSSITCYCPAHNRPDTVD